jgi:hypothetical protein
LKAYIFYGLFSKILLFEYSNKYSNNGHPRPLLNGTDIIVCGGFQYAYPNLSDPWPGCYNLAGDQVATLIELRIFPAIVAIGKYISTQKCNWLKMLWLSTEKGCAHLKCLRLF